MGNLWRYSQGNSKNEIKKNKEKMFIQIKNLWYYNVYILKLKLTINYSD